MTVVNPPPTTAAGLTPDWVDAYATSAAGVTPDAMAILSEDGGCLTYAGLAAAVDSIAGIFVKAGVRPGDRVAVIFENCLAALPLLLGAMRIRAWATPINARLTREEAALIIDHAAPRAIVCCTEGSDDAQRHAADCGARHDPGFPLPNIAWISLAGGPAPAAVGDDPAKAVAALIYTSGTTGVPKGVMLSHSNLCSVIKLSTGNTEWFRQDDCIYSVMPLSHSYGLVTIGLSALASGATLLPVARFSAARAAQAIRHRGVTAFLGVPTLYDRLIAYAAQTGQRLTPNQLRIAYVGGAPLDPGRKAAAEALLGTSLAHGYGLTEASPTVSRTRPGAEQDDLSAGVPVPGVEISLRTEAGLPVSQGAEGQLYVRGPNIMLGYYKDPAATNAAIDAKGWLDTGDIARLDAAGRLHIVGRVKEIIIRSGFNVYPGEVEHVINAHADVALSAVVGHQIGEDEEIVAFVQPKTATQIDVNALTHDLRMRLAPYKVPSRIILTDALPLTSTGKIKKNALVVPPEAES